MRWTSLATRSSPPLVLCCGAHTYMTALHSPPDTELGTYLGIYQAPTRLLLLLPSRLPTLVGNALPSGLPLRPPGANDNCTRMART